LKNETGHKFYYGWYIVAVSFWCYFFSVGTGFYAFNAILEPLCNTRGWTRTDLNLALVIGTAFGFASQYIYGTLILRTGTRVLMLFGSVVAGLSFCNIARVNTLWEFHLFYTLLFIGNGAYGGIVASSTVNNWFIEKRGKALGIATAGMSISGAVLPLLALVLIDAIGLSYAALCIGLAIMILGPVSWVIIRDWPEDLNLKPDGKNSFPLNKADIAFPANNAATANWNLQKLIRTDVFWKLGLSFGFMMLGTVGVMSQLKPRFADTGYDHMTAMIMMAATALVGAGGKYFWGILCDRFAPKRVVMFMALANALGLCLVLVKDSITALILFIFAFGFSMGGIMSTYPIIVASFFGRESFSSVYRFISIFLILQMFGYIIAGQSYDRTGSYDMAYLFFISLDIIAVFLLNSIKSNKV